MKRLLSCILSFLILVIFSSCSVSSSQKKFSQSFFDLFDTVSSVTAYDTSQKEFDAHFKLVYNELKEYAQLYDIYNDYDGVVNLKYINEHASEAPVKADERIIDLLLFGKEAYEISRGTVNICMGAVLSVWHSERDRAAEDPQNARLPDINLLQKKSLHTNIQDLIIDKENSTVYFKDAEMQIDAGAVAKGFAAERISQYIVQNRLWNSAILSLGGNIKTVGLKEGKKPFVIGIENPKNTSVFTCRVSLKNTDSVVTSGDYQRYYTVEGKNYCHIIHPDTLMPADFVSSVSVISNHSGYSDMLSTALFNMSVQEGMDFVNSMDNTEAMWVDKNGKVSYSSGFNKYLVQ